jgi:glycosyltransferase involved in cell wall biosynthesis
LNHRAAWSTHGDGGPRREKPRVTVVTAAYNAAPYIAETIESVLAQTFADFEYIVVDDGSSDGTGEIVARYAPRVTALRQENAGEGAARNRGFERACGEYIAIVDADDTWQPDKLARQVEAMDANPDAGLCYTDAATIGADGSPLVPSMAFPHEKLTCLMAMTGRNPIVTSSVLYRRTFLEKRPFRSFTVAADLHVHLKVLWRAGERSIFIDRPLVRYRIVSTSVLRQVDAWERGRMTLKAVEAFIDDMASEKPLPDSLQRRGVAHAHFVWAVHCIRGRTHYAFALKELAQAVHQDRGLAWQAARQVGKMCRNGLVQRQRKERNVGTWA